MWSSREACRTLTRRLADLTSSTNVALLYVKAIWKVQCSTKSACHRLLSQQEELLHAEFKKAKAHLDSNPAYHRYAYNTSCIFALSTTDHVAISNRDFLFCSSNAWLTIFFINAFLSVTSLKNLSNDRNVLVTCCDYYAFMAIEIERIKQQQS